MPDVDSAFPRKCDRTTGNLSKAELSVAHTSSEKRAIFMRAINGTLSLENAGAPLSPFHGS